MFGFWFSPPALEWKLKGLTSDDAQNGISPVFANYFDWLVWKWTVFQRRPAVVGIAINNGYLNPTVLFEYGANGKRYMADGKTEINSVTFPK